ncbi:hypothetical protein ES707_21783 [subsurface metagenome]
MTDNKNNKILYPRGSEWRKWDLHVHTPESILYNQFTNWDEYITKLESITDIAVLGITDYFSIEGYKKVIEYIKQGKVSNFDLILPNIEIRMLPVTTSETPINLHLIFSNLLEASELEDFLKELKFDYRNNSYSCERHKLIELGRVFNSSLSQHEAYKEGINQFKTDITKLKNIFNKNKKLRDNVIIAVSNRSEDGVSGIQHSSLTATREEIYRFADIIFSSNPEDRAYFLGQGTDDEKTIRAKYGRLKPCIHGSDAHSLERICYPCGKYGMHDCVSDSANCELRYTWIKADPTFNGLKQIIYEPEERVYVGKSPPKGKNYAKIIDRIEVKNSNNWFEDAPILLNEDLISIIGEKGAGKTALADFIALAGGDFDVKEEDPGSFIFKALKSSKQIEETIKNCAITIYWRDESSDSITITEDFKDYKDLKKVRYLSQSFIEKKCRPEQAGELQKEVENIIFQYIPAQDRISQTTFTDLKKKKTQSIQLRKSRCRQDIIDLNIQIFNLEEEINSLDTKEEERSKLQTEIEQLEKQKPKPTTEEEKNIEAKLSLLNNRKNQLNGEVAVYKTQLIIIENIKTKVEDLKTYVSKQLTDIKKDLESVELANIYEKLKFSISPDFNDKLDNKKRNIETQIQELQGAKEPKEKTKESIEVDLGILTNDYISKLPLSKANALISMLESKSSLAEDKRKTIRLFEEKIEKNRKRVNELDKNIKEIEEVKKPLLPKKIEGRDKAYKDYFILLQEEKKMLEELYAPLRRKLGKESLGERNQIEFFARIELDVENFFNKVDSIIDFSRTGTYYRKRDLLFKEIKTISEKIELVETLDVYNLMAQLYKTFEEDKDKPIDIKEQLLGRKKKIDFYNWIFDVSDFNVTYSIKYQGTNIELLSPGKKGIVLLLMYLVLDTESSIPLIIDQPEENLDNKSVYPYLINYFKTAKKRRQIIVITHNPNLVLNTDAEQIIVANFEAIPNTQNARIKYISGAIENSFVSEKAKVPIEKQGIKEHGIDILEGGPEAFGKREDKYEIERSRK